MKLKTYFALPILFFSIALMAQQTTIGIKGGLGLSNNTEINWDSKSRISPQLGGVLKYDLENVFGRTYLNYLQIELMYLGAGETNKDYKRYVNYINLPIMYQRYFSDSDRDFYLEVGPQFSYSIGSNLEDYNLNKPGRNNYQLRSDNQELNDFDVAINAGLGFAVNRQMDFNLRYSFGLMDSFNHVYEDNGHNRTSLLAFSFTYFFNKY